MLKDAFCICRKGKSKQQYQTTVIGLTITKILLWYLHRTAQLVTDHKTVTCGSTRKKLLMLTRKAYWHVAGEHRSCWIPPDWCKSAKDKMLLVDFMLHWGERWTARVPELILSFIQWWYPAIKRMVTKQNGYKAEFSHHSTSVTSLSRVSGQTKMCPARSHLEHLPPAATPTVTQPPIKDPQRAALTVAQHRGKNRGGGNLSEIFSKAPSTS